MFSPSQKNLSRVAGVLAALALTFFVAAPAFADQVLAQGSTWDKRTSKIQGDWKIVERDDGLFLVLGKDFKTKKAPDLKAFLTKEPVSQINKKKIPAGALRLGLLKSHKGGQELRLPAGAKLEDYKALAIHCEKYSKVWGVTALP